MMRALCLSVLALALGWTLSAARADNEFGAFVVACQRAPSGCVGAVPIAGEFGPTPDAARKAALAACATTAPSAFCRVIHQFKHGCAYIASGLNETTKMGGWAIASNKADAIKKVTKQGFASNVKGSGGCVGGQGPMDDW